MFDFNKIKHFTLLNQIFVKEGGKEKMRVKEKVFRELKCRLQKTRKK